MTTETKVKRKSVKPRKQGIRTEPLVAVATGGDYRITVDEAQKALSLINDLCDAVIWFVRLSEIENGPDVTPEQRERWEFIRDGVLKEALT